MSALHTSAKVEQVSKDENDPNQKSRRKQQPTSPWAYLAIVSFAIISYVTLPNPLQPHHGEEPSIQHVFYYGWLTAVSTGLGAVPLAFAPNLASYWVGISNGEQSYICVDVAMVCDSEGRSQSSRCARHIIEYIFSPRASLFTAIAAGMMIAASYSLLHEGCTFDDPHDTSTIPAVARTAAGALVGLLFINVTEKFLSGHEELSVGGLAGADAKRALLIFFVMTLHSFSEGVGIGVSFGGVHGSELGVFISASLAVHNIPEGLAMAVTLMPRGSSLVTAMVFAVLTSIPQPLMAVPAYVFVHHFIPILPLDLDSLEAQWLG